MHPPVCIMKKVDLFDHEGWRGRLQKVGCGLVVNASVDGGPSRGFQDCAGWYFETKRGQKVG